MLKSKGHTETRQTKALHHLKWSLSLFFLTQYVSFSPAWRFCSTWLACSKGLYRVKLGEFEYSTAYMGNVTSLHKEYTESNIWTKRTWQLTGIVKSSYYILWQTPFKPERLYIVSFLALDKPRRKVRMLQHNSTSGLLTSETINRRDQFRKFNARDL